MSNNRWIVRLALAGGGLGVVAAVGGCPTAPDYPDFVPSGPAGGALVAGAGTTNDGGVPPVDGNDSDAGEQNISCTYIVAGGTVAQCAVLLNVASDSLASDETSCEQPSTAGGLGGTQADGCTTLDILGCCTSASPGESFGDPNYICYYQSPTNTQAALSATCTGGGGSWDNGIP